MTPFAQRQAITDVCILVVDLERAVTFYRDRLGFALRRHAPRFADFHGAGVTLALWEADEVTASLGLPDRPADAAHRTMVAIRVETLAEVDAAYAELRENGVAFTAPPARYPWNAYACYFSDPDGTLWEIYAWDAGGPAGDFA